MYQKLYKATSSKIYSKPLFFLSLWVGVSATISLGAYTRVSAEDLVIPEGGAVPVAPEPAAPPAPEPAAVVPAPEPFEPAPAAPPPIPEPVAPDPRAVAPEPIVPAAPVPKQAQSDPYIDTKDYSVGATEYAPPDHIIVNERASGCQANLGNGQAISSSLCGVPPAQRLYTAPSAEQAPAWARASTPERWNNSAAAPVSAQTVQNTLKYSAIPPQNLAVKPLTGANPLKWMMENGERMIFPLTIPVQITSVFGWRAHPITGEWRFHSGTDLGAPMGTPVLAAYSGRVSLAEMMGGYGLSILLDHNDGKEATRYGHLSEIFVQSGQWVQQGTVIGLVGSTGNSTGPHLHFEALQASSGGLVAVDPGLELQTTMTALATMLQTARLTAQQPAPKVQPQAQQSQS
jgi:murein DD-endopeptidase MepM/ murein hydrolase activator NlpD